MKKDNKKSITNLDKRFDVVICGGGLVGMTLGCALAGAGVDVAIIDKDEFKIQDNPEYDGRASAISYGSAQVFKSMGLWDYLHDDASPINDIRVVDGHMIDGISPLFLHYDHVDLNINDGDNAKDTPFGYIIENRATRNALHKLAKSLPNLTEISPIGVKELNTDQNNAVVVLDDDREICAALAIAADGKFSQLRKAAGIKSTNWDYDQTAIVCTVEHQCAHAGVAVELFLPNGPFAMLPMTGNRSNIIWSERRDLVDDYMKLDDAAFLQELSKRFGDWLGDIKLVGPKFAYPLSLSLAETYVTNRMALIGDAGHSIHPIAGQGFNLGIRDVAAMAEILVDAKNLGLDMGSSMILQNYQRRRRFDNIMLAAVCDGLLRLFSNDIKPLRMMRDIGLGIVNKINPLKRILMRHAMGISGDLPRMVKGDKL